MKTKIFIMLMVCMSTIPLVASNKIIGTIQDATDKSALIGVNICLKQGYQQLLGVITDSHGKFTLEMTDGEYLLECSYIGYETVLMSLNISESINLGTIEMYEAVTELGEVKVEGNAVIQKVDRQVLLPNKEQVAAASDGVSLLQNLQIPRIVVNPIESSVKTLANEAVQLRINGIEATNAEVMAINPKDVIRIEYHDQPSVRYNGAAAVIDYIVKHRDAGGSLMLSGSNGVTMSGWGEYFLSGKAHFGKSSIQLIGQYKPRDLYWVRTNSETYNFSTGKIENNEVGEPTRMKYDPINLGLTYNWSNGEKNMLQITLRDNMVFTPHAHSNRDSYIYQSTDTFEIHDHTSSSSISPSLDIYYQHKLPKQQYIYLDVIGTYINSSNDRRFQQIPIAGTLGDTTDVISSAKGSKYSFIGEAIYEKYWENIMLTIGAKHNQQWVENSYLGDIDEVVNMQTAETYAFAEVQQRLGKFAYAAGIGAMHTYIEQGNQKQSNWIARPQLTMSVDCGKGVFWKYKGYISGYQPSLSAMSNIAQQIDKYQIRVGNPNLKPVMFVANQMQLTWQSKHVNLNIWTNYSYDHKPIMDETYEQIIDGRAMAVRSYDNQRGFHRLQISPSIQVRLLDNKLNFTLAPFMNYFVSLGNNYTHTHFNPGVRASVVGMYKGWQFSADITTRYNNIWGETLEYGEFYHTIGIGYNEDKWGFRAMMLYPFSTKGYSRDTKDLSNLAPNTQYAVMKDFHQTLVLNFHMNLDFGTKRGDKEKRINNEDKDNGILSGAK